MRELLAMADNKLYMEYGQSESMRTNLQDATKRNITCSCCHVTCGMNNETVYGAVAITDTTDVIINTTFVNITLINTNTT